MMWVASINFTTRKDYEADEKGLLDIIYLR